MGSIPIASTILRLPNGQLPTSLKLRRALSIFSPIFPRTFVKYKSIFSCLLLLHFSIAAISYQSFIEQNFSQIHISKFPTFRLWGDELVVFKNRGAYQAVINLWQQKLTVGFEKFFNALYKESGMLPEELYAQMSEEKIVASYHKIKDAERESMQEAIFIDEQDADPEIIGFIKMILFRYTTKRNIKIVLTDAISQATASYGSDLFGHTVFCNVQIYTKANIKKYYEALQGGYSIRYDVLPDGTVRWMEISNFLVLRLIFIASWVQHQTDLFIFELDRCLQRQMISYETIRLGITLQKFLNVLSAVFQSVNPLESVLFVLHSEFEAGKNVKLWKSLVRDVAASYSSQTLSEFKHFNQKIKQESKK